jgi:hypothetical protein
VSLRAFASKDAVGFLAKMAGLSCLLGITVDLVTANVATEYFSVYHPHVIESDSPWALALVWGVLASWWAGVIAGVLLWWMNVRRPLPLSSGRILKMAWPAFLTIWLVMMAIMASVYAVAGAVPMTQRAATFEHDRRLMAVAIAHSVEYVLAAIATAILMVRVAKSRLPTQPGIQNSTRWWSGS